MLRVALVVVIKEDRTKRVMQLGANMEVNSYFEMRS